MKHFARYSLSIAVASTLFITGCPTKKIEDRVDLLEKRVETLEKRSMGPQRPPMPPAQEEAYKLPIGNSPLMGKKDARVSVVIFSDGQCPFCKGADQLLREAANDPELKDNVNFVFKNFPLSFHANAKPAAKAALAARDTAPKGQGDAKFWAMMEKVFSDQQNLTAENFKKWAKEIGLNEVKFEETLKKNDGVYETAIQEDIDLGSNQAHVRGTPSIYVGGWELRERSVQGIKNLIKEKNL